MQFNLGKMNFKRLKRIRTENPGASLLDACAIELRDYHSAECAKEPLKPCNCGSVNDDRDEAI